MTARGRIDSVRTARVDSDRLELVFSLLAFALKAASIVECLRRSCRRRRVVALDTFFTLFSFSKHHKKKSHITHARMSAPSATDQAKRARVASRQLQSLTTAQRDQLLKNIASSLERNESKIMSANKEDIEAATNSPDIDQNLIARLKLSAQKIKNLSDGLRALSNMDEPIGKLWSRRKLQTG